MNRGTDLIDVAELARALGAPPCRVVDCRFDLFDADKGYADYLAGHIPGAVYANLDTDLASAITPSTGRHPLPSAGSFRKTLEAWGISNDSHVVAYDYGNGALAARLWWMLRYWMGHSQVSVLDGGFSAWSAAGADIESDEPRHEAGTFRREPDADVVATSEEIAAAVAAGERLTLFDAREPARFNGELEPIDSVAGHVPGAINIPLGRSLGDDGRWRDPGQLMDIWADAQPDNAEENQGGKADTPVAMCGSGVTACHLILSATIAGAVVPRLYVGSWSEWIRNPSRPVESGPREDADSG